MYGLTFWPVASTCQNCESRQEPGVIGWHHSHGALCDSCLIELAPDLGAVLVILHLAREAGARKDDPEDMEAVRYLCSFCCAYERRAETRWPRRTYVLEGLEALVEGIDRLMETLHGKPDA